LAGGPEMGYKRDIPIGVQEGMVNFRRHYIEGATILITQVVVQRQRLFAVPANVALLRQTLHDVKRLHPFRMLGYVFLPDHLHLIIVPSGSSNFSQIMHSLKRNFTVAYKVQQSISKETAHRCWQARFWEHRIRDDREFERYMHYVHYNPVKHGYVTSPDDWRDSSYHTWKGRGYYPPDWGCDEPAALREMTSPVGE
jgi:putative transposase